MRCACAWSLRMHWCIQQACHINCDRQSDLNLLFMLPAIEERKNLDPSPLPHGFSVPRAVAAQLRFVWLDAYVERAGRSIIFRRFEVKCNLEFDFNIMFRRLVHFLVIIFPNLNIIRHYLSCVAVYIRRYDAHGLSSDPHPMGNAMVDMGLGGAGRESQTDFTTLMSALGMQPETATEQGELHL